MIDLEYKNYKVTIVPDNGTHRVVIESPDGSLVRSYARSADTDWHIDRAKAIIDEEDEKVK